jgi:hypothetical protein
MKRWKFTITAERTIEVDAPHWMQARVLAVQAAHERWPEWLTVSAESTGSTDLPPARPAAKAPETQGAGQRPRRRG